MNDLDYEHLNILLAKLVEELGYKRICIIPYHVSEMPYIGIYNQDGNMLTETNGFDLKNCVNKLKTKI